MFGICARVESDASNANLIRIPARNRRQVMDWALVLASQGIGATIEHEPEGAGWGLAVAAADHAAAVQSIRLYRLENRYWHWRQPLVVQGVLWDWKVLFWVAWTGLVFFMSQTSRSDLMVTWRMDNAAVRAGNGGGSLRPCGCTRISRIWP